jgi:SAM-dependent methyltransferase
MNYYQDVYYKNKSKRPMLKYYEDIIKRCNIYGPVLDLGCGNGEFLDVCKLYGMTTTGVDICDRKINHPFFKDDIRKFDCGWYTTISCLGVLEHIEDKMSVLKNIYNMSTDNTNVIILVPIAEFLATRFGFKGTAQRHVREDQLPLREWQNMFATAGFVTTDMWPDRQLLTKEWIFSRGILLSPIKFLMALFVGCLPLKRTYQVFFKLKKI